MSITPHSVGVRLPEDSQHLSTVDYVWMVEYVDHLHKHFKHPVAIKNGYYVAPTEPGYSMETKEESMGRYTMSGGEGGFREREEARTMLEGLKIESPAVSSNFIDFGSTLVSKGQELYKSVDGASNVNRELEIITTDLNTVCTGLIRPERCINGQASDAEAALVPLCISCKELGDEFLSVLQTLKVKGRHHRWDTVRQALRTVWKDSKILSYDKRLGVFRSQIATHLTSILSGELLEGQSKVAKALDDLAASHRRLELTGVDSAAQLRREILDSLQKIPAYSCNRSYADEQEVIKVLPSLLSALPKEAGTLSKDLLIIKSLRFPTLSDRESRVREAHAETFDWLFEDSQPTDQANGNHALISMMDWLRTYNRVFWISGKAGSGKSTLMKYLYNHRRTVAALRDWAGNKQIFMARFFFWHAGTHMQKSQQGLLQTLLFHVLRQCPSLVRRICPKQWHDADRADLIWTRRELLDVFNELRHHAVDTARFCFFIDGLDEYEGNHSEVIEIIDSFSSSRDIKVCVASRDWNVFEHAYGENHGRRIRLQDLTRIDIKRFVTDELQGDSHFRELRASDTRYEDLIMEIVDRANGVFLWVFLVVHSLRRGLTNFDKVSELQQRLRELPTDLEVYFRHMLGTVEKVYQKHTARLFLMRLSARGALTVTTVNYFDEEDPNFALVLKSAGPKPRTIEERTQQWKRNITRFKARCTDLIEISDSGSVEFLHRTVYDFFETPEIQKLLNERAGADFDVHRYFCNTMLLEMKTPTPNPRATLSGYVPEFFHHARRYEIEHKTNDHRLVEEMVQSVAISRRQDPSNSKEKWHDLLLRDGYDECWIAAMAIQYGLYRWVSKDIVRVKLLIDKGGLDGIPPLALALQVCRRFDFGFSDPAETEIDSRIVGQLLEQGADPNEDFHGKALWSVFMGKICDRTVSAETRRTYFTIIELLFRHGAKATSAIKIRPFLTVCTAEEAIYLEKLMVSSQPVLKDTAIRVRI